MLSDLCLISWAHRFVGGHREIDISAWRTSRRHLLMQRNRKRRTYVVLLFCFGSDATDTHFSNSHGVVPRRSYGYWHMANPHSQT